MKKDNNTEQTYKLTIKQIPSQVLSQTIQILGLPLLELETQIKQELEENPLLEIDDNQVDKNYDIDESIYDIDKIDEEETKSSEITDTYELTKLKEFESYERKVYEKIPVFENNVASSETLQEHLLFQARLDIDNERLFTLATYIIYELDSDGYFKGDIENFKRIEDYTFSEEEIESVRERIKRYDPVGCGSKTLEEALITQLEIFYHNISNLEIYKKIIEKDLKLLATDEREIQKKYKISEEDIENLKTILKTLNPKPGANFSKTPYFILPEAIIRKTDENTLDIEFTDSYIPVLKIRKEYVDAIKHSQSKELKEKLVKAKNIVLAVEYRKNLLRNIITKIVEHQKDFLLSKQKYLNPLLIEEISRELGVNVSTVSRAIKDKFILTPLGLLPIKYFFSRSGRSIGTEQVSVDKIKKMIKEIIDNEGDKPISDDKIASILKNKGIQISRRTITKYRESMNIPPAYKRKK